MSNLAKTLDEREVVQEVGVVRQVRDASITVRTASGDYRARRSVSCLVAPEPDDRVLVASLPNGECYVLAVLERGEDAGGELVWDGDLNLRVVRGRLSIAARDGVDIASEKQVAVSAGRFALNALDTSVAFERLTVVGRYLQAELGRIKAVAQTLDTVLERLSQRVKHSYRTVQECDHVRAERVDYVARGTMSLHAEDALVTAERLVKLDGEQIHVG